MANKTGQRQNPSQNSTATGEKPSLILYGALVIIAALKDLLDLMGLGSIPLIGTAVTLCFSFTIYMLMLVFDRSGGRGNKQIAQGMVMTLGTLLEGFGFVLNFLPLQTLTVIFLYIISLRAWRAAQQGAGETALQQKKRSRLRQMWAGRLLARQQEITAAAGAAATAHQSVAKGQAAPATVSGVLPARQSSVRRYAPPARSTHGAPRSVDDSVRRAA